VTALETDVLVVGAGVVGLAVAARIARAGLSVIVLERHSGYGWEASSRNSEVVHAGMYYTPGSLKARFCVAGNRSVRAWSAAHDVACELIGKYIVATSDDELAALDRILEIGRSNGVTGLTWATPGQLRRDEPHVRAVGALWSPDTGIVDSHALMASLESAAEEAGAVFVYGTTYQTAEGGSSGFLVRFIDADGAPENLTAKFVVNAAGLESDGVAASVGINTDSAGYSLQYVRGAYFRLTESKRDLVKHLVYPVPHAGLAGLGIHATRDLSGGIRFGPHVDPLTRREHDYGVDPSLAERFATAVSRYLPGVEASDLRPDQAGIRARRIVPEGGAPDFLVVEESARGLEGWINMIGIESPGLTCCLELADHVAALLDIGGPHLGFAHAETKA
jgi:L-2-hydroxyglutarate oxidase LhgO